MTQTNTGKAVMNGIEFIARQMESVISSSDRNSEIILLSKTHSQRTIARMVGVSRTTVVNVQQAWRNQLSTGRPRSITDEMIDTAISMREDGALWKDISAAIGVSGPEIRQAIERRSGEEN